MTKPSTGTLKPHSFLVFCRIFFSLRLWFTKNGTIWSCSWPNTFSKSHSTIVLSMKKILSKDSKAMSSVIGSKPIMIGPFQNIRIAAKNTNKWQKMTGKRRKNKNCGVNCFLLRTKTVSMTKRLLSKCFSKYTRSKGIKNSCLQSKSLI